MPQKQLVSLSLLPWQATRLSCSLTYAFSFLGELQVTDLNYSQRGTRGAEVGRGEHRAHTLTAPRASASEPRHSRSPVLLQGDALIQRHHSRSAEVCVLCIFYSMIFIFSYLFYDFHTIPGSESK